MICAVYVLIPSGFWEYLARRLNQTPGNELFNPPRDPPWVWLCLFKPLLRELCSMHETIENQERLRCFQLGKNENNG